MQAVILAAGKGTRLGELTATRPKCLIEIDGRSLIRRSLDCLAWAGIGETVIVTGYCADQVQAHVGTQHVGGQHGRMKIRYRHNQDYDSTGSMMSLLSAVPDLDSPTFAILESDLLYHRDFAALVHGATGDVMLTAAFSGSGDEVYVAADRHGQLAYLGKQASPERIRASNGEFAGISVMSLDFLARYRRTAQDLMRRGERGHHYEEVIYWTARAGAAFGVRHAGDLAWTEIDTSGDLERARTRTWPQIEAQDGAPPQMGD